MTQKKLIIKMEDYIRETIDDYLKTSPNRSKVSRENTNKSILVMAATLLSFLISCVLFYNFNYNNNISGTQEFVVFLCFLFFIMLSASLLFFGVYQICDGKKDIVARHCYKDKISDGYFTDEELDKITAILIATSDFSKKYNFDPEEGIRFGDIHSLIKNIEEGSSSSGSSIAVTSLVTSTSLLNSNTQFNHNH